jgi:branched-chain amino acid aminotransferase
METRVNVDGRITAPDRAVVPALDRGFLYGDSVYEVLWWHRGTPIQADDHLARLAESARRIYMHLPSPASRLLDAVRTTVEAAGVRDDEDAYVRLVVTRGAGPLGLPIEDGLVPVVVVVVAPAHRPDAATWERGLRVALVDRLRVSVRALDPGAKTGNYMNNMLALHEARARGADDALMLNDRGEVTEGSTSNVYLVSRGQVATPALDAGILRGTTRTRILDLCARRGLPAAETRVLPADVLAADEAFLSSSVRGVIPVVAVDGRPLGDGRPGPVTRRVHAWFEEAADAEASAPRAAPARERSARP